MISPQTIMQMFPDTPKEAASLLAIEAEYRAVAFIYDHARREGYTSRKVR